MLCLESVQIGEYVSTQMLVMQSLCHSIPFYFGFLQQYSSSPDQQRFGILLASQTG